MEERFGVKNLEPEITYMRDGKMHTIKMTMGLLNMLMQSVGNYANVPLIGLDPMVNDMILRKILTLRDHKGKPIPVVKGETTLEGAAAELQSLDEIDVSVDDMEKILYFCQSHTADFTIRALHRAGTLNEFTKKAQAHLSSLTTGLIGSLGSPSNNPSATPSA